MGSSSLPTLGGGGVKVTIDGSTYTLSLPTGAMVQLEELFSTDAREMTFGDIIERVQRNSVKYSRGLMWAMLREHHDSVTLEQAGDLLLKAGGFDGLDSAMRKTLMAAQPDPQDLAALDVKPEQPDPFVAGNGAGKTKRRAGTGGISSSKRGASVSGERTSGV